MANLIKVSKQNVSIIGDQSSGYAPKKVFSYDTLTDNKLDAELASSFSIKSARATRYGNAQRYGNAINGKRTDLSFMIEDIAMQLTYQDSPLYDVSKMGNVYVPTGFQMGQDEVKVLQMEDLPGFGEDGFIEATSGNPSVAGTKTSYSSMKVRNYAKRAEQTWLEQAQSNILNVDILAAKTGAIKSNFANLQLKAALVGFEGHDITGILNMPGQSTNTTVITKTIGSMTDAEFNTFLGAVGKAYTDNTDGAVMPNRFAMPLSDYVLCTGGSVGTGATAEVGVFSRVQRITQLLVDLSGDADARIVVIPAAMAKLAKASGNIYALYNSNTVNIVQPMDINALIEIRDGGNGYVEKITYVGGITGVLPSVSNAKVITYFTF